MGREVGGEAGSGAGAAGKCAGGPGKPRGPAGELRQRGGLGRVMKPPLYLFNWPDAVGGAGTKVAHLLLLLHETFRITLVPNEPARLADGKWGRFLKRLGIHACTRRELPRRLEGWGVSICNGHFLRSGLAAEVKRRGLKIAWGSEMMWHHSGERALVQGGLVDLVLYTGE